MTHLGPLLSAYLDGETNADESREVIQHIESCDRCRAELAVVHEARSALRALPVLETPSFLFAGEVRTASVIPIHRRPAAWVAAAAAAVVVFVGGITLTGPDAIGVTLTDVSVVHEQQHLLEPGLSPNAGIVVSGEAR